MKQKIVLEREVCACPKCGAIHVKKVKPTKEEA